MDLQESPFQEADTEGGAQSCREPESWKRSLGTWVYSFLKLVQPPISATSPLAEFPFGMSKMRKYEKGFLKIPSRGEHRRPRGA